MIILLSDKHVNTLNNLLDKTVFKLQSMIWRENSGDLL